MKSYHKSISILLFLFLLACSSENKDAQKQLEIARQYYTQKEYTLAKQQLDSLKSKYPKAFPQLSAGLALLDSIRRGEDEKTIATCDSLIISFQPTVDQEKKLFSFQQNKQYQETGNYIPKESVAAYITGTTLRSGVNENGRLFIESVFIGGQKHNKLKISAKDGSYVETMPVNDDGLNYRFTNMGKTYEIIHFTGASENGIAKFIFANFDKPLTATIEGQGKYTYTLSQQAKSAIAKSYQLSVMILQLDSLKTEKEKAEYRIYYLDNKKNSADRTKQEKL
ncbi:hypothetical protein D0T84_10830 [Dysgonomonas sp. 521]|uniref:hypothetical protein n=1 Tax=Dysgonomonas sp. 521 TaxID=2302932 RepID=UPI0013D7C542|nr:hypothetical protein [Dysgonomonas sp. 521]NDV95405.1 hypothetical protein [Dysgonomonas sp. 521]